jgi:hypothetical protein
MFKRPDRLTQAIRSKFVTLAGEDLILIQRKHPLVFILPVSAASTLGLISLVTSVILYPFIANYFTLLLAALFVIFIFISTAAIRSVVDWYFNLYVVTNRKIIEVSYKPLASRVTNEVLLDQVKCTEIDTKVGGMLNELLDIGDVIVTFDRPTHQEEFIFNDVEDPKAIEVHLENALCTPDIYKVGHNGNGNGDHGWFTKSKDDSKKWKYTERIVSRGGDVAWNS